MHGFFNSIWQASDSNDYVVLIPSSVAPKIAQNLSRSQPSLIRVNHFLIIENIVFSFRGCARASYVLVATHSTNLHFSFRLISLPYFLKIKRIHACHRCVYVNYFIVRGVFLRTWICFSWLHKNVLSPSFKKRDMLVSILQLPTAINTNLDLLLLNKE